MHRRISRRIVVTRIVVHRLFIETRMGGGKGPRIQVGVWGVWSVIVPTGPGRVLGSGRSALVAISVRVLKV
jgi:hypothetical protein